MPPSRRTDPAEGAAALVAWAADPGVPRPVLATAVRYTTEELATRVPGRSVEVRVPPFAAVQCVPGPVHRRGTPPAVVEMDAATWLQLATGQLAWLEAVATGRVRASGERTDLGPHLPLSDPDGTMER